MDAHPRPIDFRQRPDAFAAPTAAEAFARARGVCQDFAHVFIAGARALDIPARYVSGHLLPGRRHRRSRMPAMPGRRPMSTASAGSASIPATICPTDAHVRVAMGLDYLGAAPVRGARYGGGGESLDVHQVSVKRPAQADGRARTEPGRQRLAQSPARRTRLDASRSG